MIFDLPPVVQMAIRLRAIKQQRTTAEVVEELIRRHHPEEIAEAETVLRVKGEPK